MKKIIGAIFLIFLPLRAFAQTLEDFGKSLETATQADEKDLPGKLYNAVAAFISNRVFQLLISAAVAMAILFIMYGSMQYFTAYGDENRATNAKKTITYAFIGLIIAFMAMGIAGLVQRSIVNRQALESNQFQVTAPGP